MKEQRNNDMYNNPQREDNITRKPGLNNTDGNKAEQKIVVNPNPRANENLKDKEIFSDENVEASQAGSEITDGEDG